MDPKLLDLLWTIYRQSGSKDYIHIISSYRSQAPMLCCAEHAVGGIASICGLSTEFYLPDVKLSKLRALGLAHVGVLAIIRVQAHLLHLTQAICAIDARRIVNWLLFSKGDTIHVPTDGKPLFLNDARQ